jgi:predicted nicotinamide N-methyase
MTVCYEHDQQVRDGERAEEQAVQKAVHALFCSGDAADQLAKANAVLALAAEPRGRLFLWEAGVLRALQKLLLAASDKSQELRASLLGTLTLLCSEPACAEEFGELGGHRTALRISKAAAEEDDESTDICAARDCVAQLRCSAPHFPMDLLVKPAAENDSAVAARPTRYTLAASGSTPGVTLYIRPVLQRQSSQYDVGFVLWPAALALARWLQRHQAALLRDHDVLEVGAGLGLTGLLAACFARTVVLSDFNPTVLANLEHNVALNSFRSQFSAAAAINCPGALRVQPLDWDAIPACDDNSSSNSSGSSCSNATDCELHAQYSCIIGADMICKDSDAEGVVRLLSRHLAHDGVAHFMLPHSRTRYVLQLSITRDAFYLSYALCRLVTVAAASTVSW